jgi:hypothetical protein
VVLSLLAEKPNDIFHALIRDHGGNIHAPIVLRPHQAHIQITQNSYGAPWFFFKGCFYIANRLYVIMGDMTTNT